MMITRNTLNRIKNGQKLIKSNVIYKITLKNTLYVKLEYYNEKRNTYLVKTSNNKFRYYPYEKLVKLLLDGKIKPIVKK
jgi:hypothetical protein